MNMGWFPWLKAIEKEAKPKHPQNCRHNQQTTLKTHCYQKISISKRREQSALGLHRFAAQRARWIRIKGHPGSNRSR
jgi:hypothetical protein